MIRIPILAPGSTEAFPPVNMALREPNGLLCAGGDLSVSRLLAAYRLGIFPWFNEGEPILWWSPDPRLVFDIGATWPNRRLARWFRQCPWRLTADTAFDAVVAGCAAPRAYSQGTWISPQMQRAYGRLAEAGHAHSVEAWDGDELIGGIYGVAIGRVFFGESMFGTRSQASKLAFFGLVAGLRAMGFHWLDGQVESGHLARLGGQAIPRAVFSSGLERWCREGRPPGSWRTNWPVSSASGVAEPAARGG